MNTAPLSELVDLTLSSVDKKSKSGEQEVQLCNYMDVYSNSFINGNLNFMMATASEREIARCSLAAGDVVITKDSETHDDIGVPALVREDIPDLVCGYHLAILRPKPSKVSGPYLYYALQAQDVQHQFHSFANGITRFGLRKSDIELVEIPSPPLKEQQDIAHVLGTLDDKIELNGRMNRNLEEMAQAIFQDWFVDFGPTRAKMEGLDPYLPPELWDLFPDELVDSELGEIPEGWEVSELGEIIEILDRIRIPLNSRQRSQRQGPYPYYGAAGIMDYVDDFLFDGVFVLTGEDGSVIDNDGYPVAQYVWGQFWVNNHAHVMKGKNGVSHEYIYLLLKDQNIGAFVTGAVQPKLSQGNLKAVPIVKPDIIICQTFTALTDPIFSSFRHHSDESHTLSAQRDTLLPKLMSGEIPVATR